MFPALKNLGFRRTYASVRPLLKIGETLEQDARKVTRTYDIFDHERDGLNGLLTISGGKLTTCRLMGEQIADLAAKKLGVKEKSKTNELELLGASTNENTQKDLEAAGLDHEVVKRFLEIVGSVDEERFMPAIRLLLSYAISED
jgi:glycerol-3-phosphate dehydrogenase